MKEERSARDDYGLRPSLLVSTIAATAAGAFVLSAIGAPLRAMIVNGLALAAGFLCAAAATRLKIMSPAVGGPVAVALGAAVVATAFLGVTVHEATRWVSILGLTLQPAFLTAPLVALLHAGHRSVWSLAGVALTAAGLGLQPDRAIAGAFFAALLTLATLRRHPLDVAAAILAAAGFLATMLQPDDVPPSAYVEGVLPAAFAANALAGVIAVMGLCSLAAPFADAGRAGTCIGPAVIGAFWVAALFAACVGNYPAPFIGYGASSIVGFVVSVSLMFGAPRAR